MLDWRKVLVPVAAAVISFFAMMLTAAEFWVAFIPSALFLVGLLLRREKWRWILGAAIVWALYGGWEALIQYQITCDAECNIRVDYLLIVPAILVTSTLGAWRLLKPGEPITGES
jgi:hypothetical protein